MASALKAMTGRLQRHWKERGFLATVRFVASRLARHEVHLVYEASLMGPRPEPQWKGSERITVVGARNLDASLTPPVRVFLGGDQAFENLEGIRKGDILFLVSDGDAFVHRGYILFGTPTKKIIGEAENTPLIAYCVTAAHARGRGFYRRALQAEMAYLKQLGHNRVIIETEPENVASQKGIESAGFALAWKTGVWIFVNSLVIQCLADRRGKRWRFLFV
jgi:hypothetical protein